VLKQRPLRLTQAKIKWIFQQRLKVFLFTFLQKQPQVCR
jgi:hypothetical protein